MKRYKFVLFQIIFILSMMQYGSLATVDDFTINQENKVKNVILIIGDGLGFEQLKLASLVEYGTNGGLVMQSNEFIQTEAETSSISAVITDSAASGTAIATGVKTTNGAIGVNENNTIVETILEYAQSLNKSTGLISTMRFNDATPASFAAHNPSRNNLNDIRDEIAVKGIEVILGGGTDWTPTSTILSNEGYVVVNTKNELLNINSSTTSKLWGNYQPRNILYEADMNYTTNVRLSDMVPVALDILNKNENGFFIMIEGGLIDFSGHGSFEPSNKTRNALETIQLDNIVKYVKNWINSNPDTLVIVTGDHETGGLIVGGSDNLDSILPDQNASEETKRLRRIERTKQIDVVWDTTYHTPQNVPLMAFGKNAASLVSTSCVYSNANVFAFMKNAFDAILSNECPEFIFGSQISTYNPSTTSSTSVSSSLETTQTSSSILVSSRNTVTSNSKQTGTTSNTEDTNAYGAFLPLIVTIVFYKYRTKRSD